MLTLNPHTNQFSLHPTPTSVASDQPLRPADQPSEMALETIPDLQTLHFLARDGSPRNGKYPCGPLPRLSKRCITDVLNSDILRVISSYAAVATHREYAVLAPYPILAQHTAVISRLVNFFTVESEWVGDGMFKHLITFGYKNAAVSWKQLEVAFPGLTYTESVQLPRFGRSWDRLRQVNQHITIQFESVHRGTQQTKDVVFISVVHYDKPEDFATRGFSAGAVLSPRHWDDAGGLLCVTSSYRITKQKQKKHTNYETRHLKLSNPPPLFMHFFRHLPARRANDVMGFSGDFCAIKNHSYHNPYSGFASETVTFPPTPQ